MDVPVHYTIEEIAEITGGEIVQHHSKTLITHLLLDSRKLIFPPSTIFFALHTPHRSGVQFIKDLYEKGVRSFLSDVPIDNLQAANLIRVKDTVAALQKLATYHRQQFKLRVIGITGSNGKTIVKEWLNQLLSPHYNIVRSPKSYNSQLGVALSVLQISEQNTLGIFEAGISTAGEMERLEKMISPSIGILTNLGEAHQQGFRSRNQKIKEKLQLFSNSRVLIFCSDNAEIVNASLELKKKNNGIEFFTWGRNKALLQIISVDKKNNFSIINGFFQGKKTSIKIPFIDNASIENAISCWCVLLSLNISQKVISTGMLQLQPVEMRLELKQGINNCILINDSYSADISSLQIALDFQSRQDPDAAKKHTVILSDFLQTGKSGNELYKDVAQLLKQKKTDRLIAIGKEIGLNDQLFSFISETYFFPSVEQFKKSFYTLHFNNEIILLKGARIFEFEQIAGLLEQKVHQTILSIDLNAIAHNLSQYRAILNPGVKIMAVVKAFSYGGGYQVANLLQFHKASYLAVAFADEGIELRKAGITLPVMVMNPEENTFNSMVKYDLEPELFSFSILASFQKYLLSSGLNYFPVHLKLDTGMHRLGFEPKDIPLLKRSLQKSNLLKVQSVFSHLSAGQEKKHDDFTLHQANIFMECCKKIRDALGYDFIRHISNTSAAGRHKDLQMDMVRIGIGLYGIDPNKNMERKLQSVLTLTSTISQVKKLKKGEAVGYGRNAVLKKDSVIATVRIGYADGYSRSLSNGIGKMLVHHKPAPVIGNICMDMTMIDVTGIRNVKEGDEVIVFGKELPLQLIAKWCHTIPYEIMTGISQRVKRVYFEE